MSLLSVNHISVDHIPQFIFKIFYILKVENLVHNWRHVENIAEINPRYQPTLFRRRSFYTLVFALLLKENVPR